MIERYRRREQSVEEALIDMYLAGVSTRQVDDISRLLWGERMSSQTLSDKLKGVYAQIDEWRQAVGAFVPVPVRGRRVAQPDRTFGHMDLNYFSFAAEVRLTMGNNYRDL